MSHEKKEKEDSPGSTGELGLNLKGQTNLIDATSISTDNIRTNGTTQKYRTQKWEEKPLHEYF